MNVFERLHGGEAIDIRDEDYAFFLCSALHICTINSNGTTLMSGRKETMRT